MRITGLEIDGFGVWHDLKLPNVSTELTAFYGENEAGKTTLMQFIRSVFYGMSPERRSQYLPPLCGGQPGGSLDLVDSGERFRVRRIADRGADDVGRVTITTSDGQTVGDRLLREALADVDETTFNNVFAVGLDEIQKLGTLSGTKAAEMLYRLTSGLDRVSLYDVIQELRHTRSQLLGDDDLLAEGTRGEHSPSKLIALAARRDQLRSRVEQLKGQNRQWSQCAVRLAEIDEEMAEVEKSLREKQHTARTVEIAMGLKTNWRRRIKVSRQLRQLASEIVLPDDAIERLDDLNARIEHHRREADVLRGQRHQLRDQAEQLGINELVVRNSCRIEAIGEQRDWLQALERQMERLETEAIECEQRFQSEQSRLSGTLGLNHSRQLREISQSDLKGLRPQIQAIQAAQSQVDQAQDQLNRLTQNEQTIKLQLESAVAGGEQHGLPMDLQETSDLVANLRKRLQVEQRIEQARAHQLDMEQQSHELLDDQVMPLWLFGLLLGTFVLGALMIGLWLIVPDTPLGKWGGWLAVLGAVGAAFSAVFKFFAEDAAAEKLDACDRQLEIAEKQIEEAELEKEQLDAELPMVDGSVVLRLQAAEQHLAELENIVPVETERKLASSEVEQAKQQVQAARQKLNSAMSDWQSRLVALGLPKELDPTLFSNVADRHGKLANLQLQAETRREEVAARRREQAALERRITAIFEEVGEARDARREVDGETAENQIHETDRVSSERSEITASRSLVDKLDRLVSQLREQRSLVERRKELQQRARQLKVQEGRHRRALAALSRHHESLLTEADCEDEAAYRQLAERQEQAAKLRRQRKAISREIAAAIGEHEPEETFAQLLRPPTVDQLEELWEEAAAEQETIQEQLRDLAKLQGEIKQQQRTLAEDRTLAEVRLELSCVNKQLADGRKLWREHATVSRMLERIRADYEAHRQPETLHEASGLLKRLTAGKYRRIWTPLANDILLVETADGQSLSVEALSRGTREQLLLSVRLALVAQMARRGVKLPMVLDDVLVNFDAVRSRRAAEVLKEFAAAGHQLLLFTCHEHVWNMFRELGADCRRLSGQKIELPKPKKKLRRKKKVVREPEPPKPEVPQAPAEAPPLPPDYEYPFDEILSEPVEIAEPTEPADEFALEWSAEPAEPIKPAETAVEIEDDAALAYIVSEESSDEQYREYLHSRRA